MLLIDNQNITTFKASLLVGSYKSFLSYPTAKPIPKNDWAEFHYLEYDISEVKFENKKVSLFFWVNESLYETFSTFLSQKNKRLFDFQEFNIQTTLRFEGMTKTDYSNGWVQIEAIFSEDIPFIPNYQAITFNAYFQEIYFNGQPLAKKYGITLLQGTKASFLNHGNTKKTLEITHNSLNGIISQPQEVFFAEKTATLKCFIWEEKKIFKAGYFNFLNDLKAGAFAFRYDGTTYQAVYKSGKITDFYIDDNKVWAEFDVEVILYE